MSQPESTGTVFAKSAKAEDAPEIRPNYLAHEYDRKIVVAGLRIARDLFAQLVKTALSGGDPNYGRVLQAAGQALAGTPHAFEVDLSIQGVRLVERGAITDLSQAGWEDLEHAVLEDEVDFAIGIPGEGGEAELFFSDLGHDYVTLNADYTT